MTDDQAKRILRFEGALTLPEADAVRTSLLAALHSEARVVELDCAAASEIDASFLQIVLAARRSAAMSGKSVTLSSPAAGALREALMRGGLVDEAGPRGSADDPFWMAGSTAS